MPPSPYIKDNPVIEEKIRILLADDHKVLRSGLRMLIESESDLNVIGEASNGDEAIYLAADLLPDVIVLDLGMPGTSGFEVIKELRQKKITSRIVVLSMHVAHELVMQAVNAGADGYVPKSVAHNELIQAIRVVFAGKAYLHPVAATAVIDELTQKREQSLLLNVLSERERDVLRWTALGYTSREISEELALSPKTIETYRQRIMRKLNIEHRSELVRFAIHAGLLNNPD